MFHFLRVGLKNLSFRIKVSRQFQIHLFHDDWIKIKRESAQSFENGLGFLYNFTIWIQKIFADGGEEIRIVECLCFELGIIETNFSAGALKEELEFVSILSFQVLETIKEGTGFE